MNKVSIIGAGPAGLASAYYAKKNKIDFEIFEASNRVGGNCVTFKVIEFLLDSGAHRLHDVDSETTKLFKSLLKNDLRKINIPSQIFLEGKFIDFPLAPLNLIKILGFKKLLVEGAKIISSNILFKNNKQNFKSFAEGKYGKFLAKKLLLNYSEKLWGLPAEKLSSEISGKRLKGLDIKTLFIEFFFGKAKRTKHLDGSFYYPKYGIGSLFEELSNELGLNQIYLNKRITKLVHKDFKIIEIEINNNEKIKVDTVISTLPLNVLIKNIYPAVPEHINSIIREIKYRNIILIAVFLNKKTVNENGSMYFPSEEFVFTRIYEPRNRSHDMSPKNKTSLVVEIPCFSSDKIWKTENKEIKKMIIKNIADIGLINENEVLSVKAFKIKDAYPVLEKQFESKVEKINSFLSKFKNLKNVGRNAMFKYSHIHDHFVNARKIFSEK